MSRPGVTSTRPALVSRLRHLAGQVQKAQDPAPLLQPLADIIRREILAAVRAVKRTEVVEVHADGGLGPAQDAGQFLEAPDLRVRRRAVRRCRRHELLLRVLGLQSTANKSIVTCGYHM